MLNGAEANRRELARRRERIGARRAVDDAVDEHTSVGRNQITTHHCENTINLTIDSSASRPAWPWRSPAARLALALIPGWITLAALVYHVGWPTKLIVGSALALTVVDPVAGFLAVVAFAPLGHLFAVSVAVENFRMTEAVTLAFFVGWLLRGWTDHDGPRMPRAIPTVLAGAVVASIVGVAWQLGRRPGELTRDLDLLIHAYNIAEDRLGVTVGFRFIEGLAMAAAAVTLFRRRPRLAVLVPAVLAGGGVAAAAASWLLWYGIAPAAVLRDHARNGYRVAAHVADANAAGSAFAMLTSLSIGMALRARGRARVVWLAVAAVNASGVWLSASRTALVVTAAALIAIALWSAAARWRSRAVALAAAGVLLTGAIGGAVYLWRTSGDQLSRGSTLRAQFNETSARMIAERPLVGVGVGQYFRLSSLFMTPQLSWFYGSENAHNYFLQVAAELGLPGLALFAWLLATAFSRTARATSAAPQDARLIGIACGVAAFLVTAAVSHPFLVDEVAAPFWVQFGILIALAGAATREPVVTRPRLGGEALPFRVAVFAAVVYVVLSPGMRVLRGEVTPPAGSAVDGFYGWDTDGDGARYRWTGEYASVFAPGDARSVGLRVRIPAGSRGLPRLLVMPSIGGRHLAAVPVSDEWTTIDIDLPPSDDVTRPRRVDLRVLPSAWQPALHVAGSADLRRVGVQVGDCTFAR